MPSLTRRLPGLAATVPPGPSLVLTVRYQARRYRAEIYDPGTERRWRCPHRHFTHAWASQCAAVRARASAGSAGSGRPGGSAGPGGPRAGPA